MLKLHPSKHFLFLPLPLKHTERQASASKFEQEFPRLKAETSLYLSAPTPPVPVLWHSDPTPTRGDCCSSGPSCKRSLPTYRPQLLFQRLF